MNEPPHSSYPGASFGGPRWSVTEDSKIPRETWRYTFAGLALAGLCANPETLPDAGTSIAELAHQRADALLDALEKEEGETP